MATTIVPDVVGMSKSAAKIELEEAELVCVYVNPNANGTVREQNPVGGTQVSVNSSVHVTLNP